MTLLILFGLLSVFLAVLGVAWLRFNTARKANKGRLSSDQSVQNTQTADWIIYYASQRGRAKTLALQSARSLELGGMVVDVHSLSDIKPNELEGKTNGLFITSTFGSGQAPEHARKFERTLKKNQPNLSTLNFAVLALGDKQYDRFCGFGKTLNQWLTSCQAKPIAPVVTVSQMDIEAINTWQRFIQGLGGNLSAFEAESATLASVKTHNDNVAEK